MSYCCNHYRLPIAPGSLHWHFARAEFGIINARWQLLVDILFAKSARSSQGSGEVLVKRVGAPEDSSTTLHLDLVSSARGLRPRAPVQPDGQGQVSCCAEEAPAVVDARSGEQVEALCESSLYTGEADPSPLLFQLILCNVKVSGAGLGSDARDRGWRIETGLSKDHEEKCDLRRCLIGTIHGPRRSIKLLEPGFDRGPKQVPMRRDRKVEIRAQ